MSQCTPATCKIDGDYFNDGPDQAHYQLVNFDNILYSFNTLFMYARRVSRHRGLTLAAMTLAAMT